jgi:hypothetical protein
MTKRFLQGQRIVDTTARPVGHMAARVFTVTSTTTRARTLTASRLTIITVRFRQYFQNAALNLARFTSLGSYVVGQCVAMSHDESEGR